MYIICNNITDSKNHCFPINSNNILFLFILLGGSLATFLAKGLHKISTDWSKWKLFFCDERVVPLDSQDSNYGVYKTALLGVVPLVEDQFVKINPHLPGMFLNKCVLGKKVSYVWNNK